MQCHRMQDKRGARLELFRWLEQGKLRSRTNLDRSTKVHGFYWNPVASSHWSIELWAYITVGHRKHAEVEVVSSSRGERWSGRGQGNGWRPGGVRPKISEPQNQSSAAFCGGLSGLAPVASKHQHRAGRFRARCLSADFYPHCPRMDNC
jgi:hypothetical protein